MATRPGFVSNAGGAAFGNPNITAQGQRAGATQAIPAPSGAGAGRGGQGGPTAAQLASVGNSTPPSTPSTGPNTKPTYNDDIGLPDTHYNPLQNYRNMTYNTRLTMMPLAETTLTRLERSYDYKNGIVMWGNRWCRICIPRRTTNSSSRNKKCHGQLLHTTANQHLW